MKAINLLSLRRTGSQNSLVKSVVCKVKVFVYGWPWLALALTAPALAFQPTSTEPASPLMAANGTVELAFTPGQDAAALIINAIAMAHRQILVQAFSFTHDGIAQALIAAHHRGVEVRLIADREQTEKMQRGQVPSLAAAGILVWLDGEHQSAHNKVMVIDAGSAMPTVITGSYNFTRAAQFKNAENVLIMHGNKPLTEQYRLNWQRHLPHSLPYRAAFSK